MVRLKALIKLFSLYPSVCFNSKMVRLKGQSKFLALATYPRFNSKMVRLKAWKTRRVHLRLLLFQFQNGAIKRTKAQYIADYYQCFNSKMVRLKDIDSLDNQLYNHSFNSKMVRLKVKIWSLEK